MSSTFGRTAAGAATRDQAMRHHLVKLKRHFLDLILAGRKTIESRFMRFCRPPWNQVAAGDWLWLKESGGPIRGCAQAARVEQFRDLTGSRIRAILERYGAAIGVGPEYAAHLADKRFGVLVWVKAVRPTVPVAWRGGTMVAWVVLPRAPYLEPGRPAWRPRQARIELPVTDGMLRNGYIAVGGPGDFFPADAVGQRAAGGRLGWPIVLELADVGAFATDLVAEGGRLRLRGPVAQFFRRHRLAAGDRLVIRPVSDRRYRCEPAGPAGASASPGCPARP